MKTRLINFSYLLLTGIMVLGFTGCKQEETPLPNDPAELAKAEKPACRRTKSYFTSSTYSSTTTFEYDNENRLIAQKGTTTSSTGESGYTKNFEYNAKGQVVTHTSKSYYIEGDRKGSANWSTFFEYNQKGQAVKLEEVSVNPQTGAETRRIYTQEYDSEGNRIKVNRLHGDSAAVVSLYEYKNGDCVKATNNIGSQFEWITEYEYYLDRENKMRAEQATIWGYSSSADKHMLKKETTTPKYDPQGSHFTEYSYEYNDQGFVVKSVITQAGEAQNATTALHEYICP